MADAPFTNEPFNVTSDSVTINWQLKLNKMNNCTLASINTVCYYIDHKGHGYEPQHRQSTDSFIQNPDDEFSFFANVTVHELSPYTPYSCKALAINSGGNSAWSVNLTLTTLEGRKC